MAGGAVFRGCDEAFDASSRALTTSASASVDASLPSIRSHCVDRTAPTPPPSPRLFLVDGYALIYRAFFALIARPLTTSRGENTSAAWGIVNFLQRLLQTHQPDYLGWVHDSGLSFRHERYPAYKATREKLTERAAGRLRSRHGAHSRDPRRESHSNSSH